MAKKKSSVKKKVSVSKTSSKIVSRPVKKKCCYSWVWYLLGALVILGALVLLYNGMTGNVTGPATPTSESPSISSNDPMGIKNFISQTLGPLVTFVIGGNTTDDTLVFAKFLFFVIILLISFVILEKVALFDDKKWVVWVLSIVISILGVRWMGTDDVIRAVILPSNVFAVALSAGIPFVLYFLIVERSMQGSPRQVRNMAWIFFMVIFASLWWYRYDKLVDSQALLIYPITVFLGLLCLTFDGTIQKWFRVSKIARYSSNVRGVSLNRIQNELATATDTFQKVGAGYIGVTPAGMGKPNGATAYQADSNWYNKEIARILKTIK